MKKKKLVIAIATAAVIIIGGTVLLWKRYATAQQASENGKIETAVVTRRPLKQTVECTGRVVSNLDVEIKCKASGEVIKLPFDISDPVKMGDLLLELDPSDQARSVQQAEASLAASQARLAQAKVNLAVAEKNLIVEKQRTDASVKSAEARASDAQAKAKREQELLARKQSSVEDAETAQTTAVQALQELRTAQAQSEAVKASELELEARREEINLAQSQVDADLVSLSLAQQRLTETKVMAPIDGVVSARQVQVGQIIASGVSNVGGGTTVLTLSDLSRLFVLASVDESDIGSIALGQRATITADAYPGKEFSGEIVRIAAKGVNVSNVVTFEVRIEVLSDNKQLLKPEMTTNIAIITAEKDDALVVPATAIIRKEGNATVTVLDANGQQNSVPVETGIYTPEGVEILSGLQENDTTVVRSQDNASRWRAENQGRLKAPTPFMMGPPRRMR